MQSLHSPNTAQRIDDIAAEAIVPPVRYRSKTIQYDAGSCVVLRIEPSSGALHMVHAYDEFRYYRRTELAARPMSEPEVRQALDQIVRAQADGDRSARELFDRMRGQYEPPFAWLAISTGLRDERVDPRTIRDETLQRYLPREFAHNGRIEDLGYRSALGDYAYDFGVARDGSLWTKWPIEGMGQGFKPFMLVDKLARLAAITSDIWAEQSIFPTAARLALQLECPEPLRLFDGEERYEPAMLTTSKWLSFVVTPGELRSGERVKIARMVADRVYQLMGIEGCPFFGDDGTLRPTMARQFTNSIW